MTPTPTLDEIGLRFGTDKASSIHNYLEFYESFFAPLRNKPLTILEIGVLGGASLKMWEEYFPLAKIIGVDIVPSSKRFEEGRVTIVLADQSNIEELSRLAVEHGPFDIIIEDGSHMWEHQITSLRVLFPFLRNNGFYVVEDLQTNYGSMKAAYKGNATSTCVDYLKAWLDLRVGDEQVEIGKVEDAFLRSYGRGVQFITFYRHACLIKKQLSLPVREVSAGKPLVAGTAHSRCIPVGILVHVGYKGDVFGPEGFVNLGSKTHSFQGISIESGGALEYRVQLEGKTWSEWSPPNSFVGTRGQSMPLTGIAVRLVEDAKKRCSVRIFCRFEGSEDIIEAADGQDCVAVSGGALYGIQIELIETELLLNE